MSGGHHRDRRLDQKHCLRDELGGRAGLRDKTKISTSASGERIQPRNLTPGGWPATEVAAALLGSPVTLSNPKSPKCFFAVFLFF